MRIIFMGTPDFSVPALNALVEAGHEIVAVYCQPPRPAGRGKKDRPSPVQMRAETLSLPVLHPANFKSPGDQAAFAAFKADVAVVVAYGLILPQSLLDSPSNGCLNIHASLLPRWRGAAPIHRAIMAGDKETGVSIMQMEAGLDTGPVLLSDTTPIGSDETTGTLHDRLSEIGAELIVETLSKLEALCPQPQPADGVTYAEKIDKAETQIDWSAPAEEIDRKIRGLSPFPGAWIEYEGQRLKFLSSVLGHGSGLPGEVLDNELTIACGTKAIRVLRLQRAGKGPQDSSDFLRGMAMTPGKQL